MTNWKTNIAGAMALLALIVKVYHAGKIDFAEDGALLSAAVGLFVAKDHNVTGGTSPQ